MKSRVLITGGNGFIGRHLCKEFDRQGIDFISADAGIPDQVYLGRTRELDIMNVQELEDLFEEYQPNTLIHLAAIASPAHKDSIEIYRINVLGAENLLNIAAKKMPKGSRVLLISTAGVYGNQVVEKLHEKLPFNPVNHYSYSKMVTEVMSRQYQEHLDICIVRPFNIVGVGQSQNFLLPKLIYHFKNRLPVLKIGNLAAVRDYVSVEYCSEVLSDLCTMENMPSIVNICSGIGHSCQDVINLLAELSGFMPEVVPVADFIRPNEIWSLIGDDTVLRTVTQDRYYTQPLHNILEGMLVR